MSPGFPPGPPALAVETRFLFSRLLLPNSLRAFVRFYVRLPVYISPQLPLNPGSLSPARRTSALFCVERKVPNSSERIALVTLPTFDVGSLLTFMPALRLATGLPVPSWWDGPFRSLGKAVPLPFPFSNSGCLPGFDSVQTIRFTSNFPPRWPGDPSGPGDGPGSGRDGGALVDSRSSSPGVTSRLVSGSPCLLR